VNKLTDRLAEPSTWAAMASVFAGLTAYSVTGVGGAILQGVSIAGVAVCGIMGILVKEKGPTAS